MHAARIMLFHAQGAFCVKFMRKICDCTPTFIINYIMIFETLRRRYPNFCAWNAQWFHAPDLVTLELLADWLRQFSKRAWLHKAKNLKYECG